MVKFIFIVSALFIFTSSFIRQKPYFQSNDSKTFLDTIPVNNHHDDSAIVFTKAEKEPQFNDDAKAFYRFLVKNMKPEVPVNNGAPVGRYRVVIRFIVEKDGTVTNIKPQTKHGYGMEAECIRMIELSGKWIPAMQNGHLVRCYKEQPFIFEVSES